MFQEEEAAKVCRDIVTKKNRFGSFRDCIQGVVVLAKILDPIFLYVSIGGMIVTVGKMVVGGG